MDINLPEFFRACNPNKTLDSSNSDDRKYYIDLSSVRGNKIIEEMERTIVYLSPNDSTCQLFTGHIGCGKSTELLRLKFKLEEQGFHVVYFESTDNLAIDDVDITDILFAIIEKVNESLKKVNINLKPSGLNVLLNKVIDRIKGAELSGEISFDLGLIKLTSALKNSHEIRHSVRDYLEPRTDTILENINQEFLMPAIQKLKEENKKKGLVVIVDNLDRVSNYQVISSKLKGGYTQAEYIFVERGEQLKKLNCHVVYTIPLALNFSSHFNKLTYRFGISPNFLPMVRVKSRQTQQPSEEGMMFMKQLIMVKAFPDLNKDELLEKENILKVFDDVKTLENLCQISGGHIRNLLVILYGCLQKNNLPPIPSGSLEEVIRQKRDNLRRSINGEEWKLLRQIMQKKELKNQQEYQTLLQCMFVFGYQDKEGEWFDINPLFSSAKELHITEENISHVNEILQPKDFDFQ